MTRQIPFLLRVAALLVASAGLAQAEVRLPDYSRHVLDNGAVVLLMPRHDVPLVALDITVRGGAVADPADRSGTSDLLAQLMQKGAGGRDAAGFAAAIDAVGGQLDIGAGRHAISLSAEFLAKDAGLMLDLAADALRRPRLQREEFDKLRQRAIQSLQSAKDSGPDGLIDQYGEAWLFTGHAYGRPVGGSEQSLAAIEHAQLQQTFAEQVGGDRAIISVAGDFDSARMLAEVRRRFADWPKAQGALPALTAATATGGRRVLLVDKPGSTQTYFWFGNIGASINDPQRVAQDLVQTVFGGRFTSMLNSELRVKSGLTYGARANLDRRLLPGAASISSFTRTEATGEALDLTLATLARLHADGIDQAGLDSGRNYLLGQFPPSLETARQLAAQLGALELYGQDRDEIDRFAERLQALTPADLVTAARVFAPADQLVLVLIGDAKAIRDTAARYGQVTEMALSEPRFQPQGE